MILAKRIAQKIKSLPPAKTTLLTTTILLAGVLLFWGAFSFTRLSTISPQSFIARIGTPLLGWQMALAAAAGLIVVIFFPGLRQGLVSPPKSRWIDAGFCLLIWLTAALLWLNSPVQNTYNIRQPVAPNNAYYPYSDAANYTAGAHALLVGKGYPRPLIDKPVYLAYLAILNLVAGQSFNRVIDLQVILLSLLPVILYLIGKTLHSRSAGIIAAILSICKQLNVMATTPIIFHVASSKVMTVEPITGLILVLFLFFLIRWLKNPTKKQFDPILAGGFLGMASLIRLTPLVLLPLSLFVAWSANRWSIRLLLRPVLLFLSVILITLLPWMVFNQITFGNPFTFINRKTISVVVEHRYSEYVEDEQPAIEPSYLAPTVTAPPQPTAVSQETNSNPTAPQIVQDSAIKRYLTLSAFIFDRFIINSLTNIFVLPPKMFSDTLSSIFEHYYWRYNILGGLDIESAFSLLINFLLITLGIASTWTSHKIVGLLPLLVNLGYNFGNALTLSAAGFRSVVPVDWAVVIYFAIGLSTILHAMLKKHMQHGDSHESNPSGNMDYRLPLRICISACLIFFLIGALPVIFTFVFPPRYTSEGKQNVLTKLEAQQSIARYLPPGSALRSFIGHNTTAMAITSRALFPRYYLPFQGDNTEESGVLELEHPYPRLSFALVSPDLSEVYPFYGDPEKIPVLVNVNMPLAELPDFFPNAVDVSVIGCFDHLTGQIDGLAVVLHGNIERIYLRSPLPEQPVCDLPQPVCENNICK